ncbi:MAG: hypothetical protein ACYTFI_11995 [Planctomycetota bacterium]|jgi:tetratricopeptide (TPR) repeat protein
MTLSISRDGFLGLAGLLALAALPAVPGRPARAQGVRGGASGLTEREVPYEGGTITIVTYRGKPYRRINVSALRGLMVGSARLQGLPVCVEGKFDRYVPPNIQLMGSDREFYVANRSLLGGLVGGDNIWVAGVAEKKRREASCRLKVEAIVRLKDDFGLFRDRYNRHSKAGNWKRLLELGEWIQESGKLVASARTDIYQYQSDRKRAVREALRIRVKLLDPADANGHCEVARMYMDLLGRGDVHKAVDLLLRAIDLAPRHKKAAESLRELGYVWYDGRWMTKEQRDVLKRKKAEKLASTDPGTKTDPESTGATKPGEKLSTSKRIIQLLDVKRRARSGPGGLKTVAERLLGADEAVARRIVWVLANSGAMAEPRLLSMGRQSKSVAVLKDVADAYAWSRRLEDLSLMIRSEKTAEVREHATAARERALKDGKRDGSRAPAPK